VSSVRKVIIMKRHIRVIGSRTVLRTMIIADVLADAAVPAAGTCVGAAA